MLDHVTSHRKKITVGGESTDLQVAEAVATSAPSVEKRGAFSQEIEIPSNQPAWNEEK